MPACSCPAAAAPLARRSKRNRAWARCLIVLQGDVLHQRGVPACFSLAGSNKGGLCAGGSTLWRRHGGGGSSSHPAAAAVCCQRPKLGEVLQRSPARAARGRGAGGGGLEGAGIPPASLVSQLEVSWGDCAHQFKTGSDAFRNSWLPFRAAVARTAPSLHASCTARRCAASWRRACEASHCGQRPLHPSHVVSAFGCLHL
mgnify:CR=1 FL=1